MPSPPPQSADPAVQDLQGRVAALEAHKKAQEDAVLAQLQAHWDWVVQHHVNRGETPPDPHDPRLVTRTVPKVVQKEPAPLDGP